MATASDDYEYYSKVNKLQEFLNEKETKRRQLHHQYNKYMKSDKKRSQSQAAQLQAYWKQLCENEKASHARNQRLLKEFDRVEAHVTSLSLRTERLRRVQEQYKRQVGQRYPNWRQRYIEQLIRKRKQPNAAKPTPHVSHAEETFDPGRGLGMHPQNSPQRDAAQPANRSYDQTSPSPVSPTREVTPQAHHRPEDITGRYQQQEADVTRDPGEITPGGVSHHRDSGGFTPTRLPAEVSRESTPEVHHQTGSGTFIVTELEEPTKDASQENRGDPYPSMAPIQSGAVAHRQIFGGKPTPGRTHSGEMGDVSSRTDPFSSASGGDSQEEEEAEEEMRDSLVENSISEKTGESGIHGGSAMGESGTRSAVPPPEKVDTEIGTNDDDRMTGNMPAPSDSVQALGQGDYDDDRGIPPPSEESDIGSDLSLPLSEGRRQSSPEQKHAPPPEPELTINGYLHLLQGLENNLERTEGHVDLYDERSCSPEERISITKDANSKLPMNTYDAPSLSAVVLQELPLLVQASPRGYLISDQVLSSERPILEVTIRSAITTNALPFWDRTLKHMVFLIRRGYYEPAEIALQVAPLMLAEDSTMTEKAIQVVTNLLEDAVEEPTLEESSLTQTSIEETPSAPKQESKVKGGAVPPLNLDMTADVEESSEDEDSFFDQAVPLKETDAYKQMLQSVQPKSGRQAEGREGATSKDAEGLLAELEDSSSDDDIDGMLSPSATGRSSPVRPKQNVSPPLTGMLNQDNDAPVSPVEGATQAGRVPTKETPSPDRSDVVSSSSETPEEGGGYVPSAMDNSLKSSGRKSSVVQRSSSFWGEDSDLDSEMSVPMGTGGVEDDKDDFDFYD